MQAASAAYKKAMKEILRNHSFMRVTIGMINQTAQASAAVADPAAFTYFSSLKKPFDNYQVTELYEGCDQDWSAVDGSMYFLPREKPDVVLNAGLVTEELLGTIEIRFPVALSIKGLTVEFGKAYPVDFSIVSDRNTVEIKDNGDGHFVTEEIFEEATFLRFVPGRMVNGQSRFRIHQITMGIGIYFDNQKILSASKKEHISPITEELPTIDFSMTAENRDRQFDIENSESSVQFLEIGQNVEVLHGQELEDGTVEWMPGAKLSLKDWSADDEELEISATDRFDTMEDTYYRVLIIRKGFLSMIWRDDVFQDAGVDSRDYYLDPYLKNVLVKNPVPAVAHKEALQLIANAGRCIIYQDREGKIFLKSSLFRIWRRRQKTRHISARQSTFWTGSQRRNTAWPDRIIPPPGVRSIFFPIPGRRRCIWDTSARPWRTARHFRGEPQSHDSAGGGVQVLRPDTGVWEECTTGSHLSCVLQ